MSSQESTKEMGIALPDFAAFSMVISFCRFLSFFCSLSWQNSGLKVRREVSHPLSDCEWDRCGERLLFENEMKDM